MIEKKKMLVFILLAFTIFPTITQALSLNTVQKKKSAEIEQGETAKFTVLFWNFEDRPTPISLKIRQAPDDWVVIIRPQEFLLNKSKIGPPYDNDKEYVGIPGAGDVEAFPLKVLVNVPRTASLGNYEVLVTVTAGKSGSGLSILQERTFKFIINVKKASEVSKDIGQTISDASGNMIAAAGDAVSSFTGMISSAPFEIQIAILIASIITALAIVWVVYKRV